MQYIIILLFERDTENSYFMREENGYGFYLFAGTNNTIEYLISILFSILCKTAVPLFFMVSGVLLLNKDEVLLDVLKKGFLNMVSLFVWQQRLFMYGTNI